MAGIILKNNFSNMYSLKNKIYAALAVGLIASTASCVSVKPYLGMSCRQNEKGTIETITELGLKFGESESLLDILRNPSELIEKSPRNITDTYNHL